MPVYARSAATGSFCQGEILSNVVEVRISYESLIAGQDEPELDQKVHPLAIVLSQGCDLDWDFMVRTTTDPDQQQRLANKLIPNVLFCELWHATDLRGHQKLNSQLWRRISSNGDERYHILPPCPADFDSAGEGLPELAIDFKRVFTVATDELYYRLRQDLRRRCVVTMPFVQNLSNRFGYFHLRVALPDERGVQGPLQRAAIT